MQYALNALVMGYRPLWSADRRISGVQLFLHDSPEESVDVAHLLRILQETWAPSAPRLLLSPQSPALLKNLLAHIQPCPFWALEVRGEWLQWDPGLLAHVQYAADKQVHLIWRGPYDHLPTTQEANLFASGLLSLNPQDVIAFLRNPQQLEQCAFLVEHQMYEDLHSQSLLRCCLERYHASAIAGWPDEDVLHNLRGAKALQPSHEHVLRLMKAVDADQPLDNFEDILSEDALLAYRLMLFANSAAMGARHPIDSLRRALVMLGYGPLQRWLANLLTHACEEPDLQPVRQAMVHRAQLTSLLLDAGVSQELRSEVYLCGLFSRLDDILGEPLADSLARLPLSERIADAALRQEGPYAASLQLAIALEHEGSASAVRDLCAQYELSLENVNRTLLRLICSWHSQQPRW